MSDLIDREAVREFIKSYRNSTDVAFHMEDHLDEIPAASPWHRVEDGLPKPGEIVLACNDVGTVNVAYLANYGKWYAANNTMYDSWTWMPNVTHWMPLPEPPKEDANGDK